MCVYFKVVFDGRLFGSLPDAFAEILEVVLDLLDHNVVAGLALAERARVAELIVGQRELAQVDQREYVRGALPLQRLLLGDQLEGVLGREVLLQTQLVVYVVVEDERDDSLGISAFVICIHFIDKNALPCRYL